MVTSSLPAADAMRRIYQSMTADELTAELERARRIRAEWSLISTPAEYADMSAAIDEIESALAERRQ